MVRDGYYYGLALFAAAVLVGWFARPGWALAPALLALFFLWFFRDPQRSIPVTEGAVVSPADGKITDVSIVADSGKTWSRISIFLSVFDVHVNRSPISGTISSVRYQRGKFLNAINGLSAVENEQNIVGVEGDGQMVIFKQIAGLLARRIVFHPQIGDRVERGQRVGLIKFGSRVDVFFDSTAALQVKIGDRVRGGASVLAQLVPKGEMTGAVSHSSGQEKKR